MTQHCEQLPTGSVGRNTDKPSHTLGRTGADRRNRILSPHQAVELRTTGRTAPLNRREKSQNGKLPFLKMVAVWHFPISSLPTASKGRKVGHRKVMWHFHVGRQEHRCIVPRWKHLSTRTRARRPWRGWDRSSRGTSCREPRHLIPGRCQAES